MASHAVLIVRAAGATNTSNGLSKFYNLGDGDGATIDIQTASSTSILGAGTALPLSHLRNEWWCKSFNSSFGCDKPFYVIPFCDKVPKAYKGEVEGYLPFTGDSKKLVLNLPTAGTSEVHTFTPSGIASQGYYRFSWKGEVSANLAYNATAATMAIAFEAMRSVQAKSITVTFSGPATGANFTATYTCPETRGMQNEAVQVIPIMSDSSNIPVDVVTVHHYHGNYRHCHWKLRSVPVCLLLP